MSRDLSLSQDDYDALSRETQQLLLDQARLRKANLLGSKSDPKLRSAQAYARDRAARAESRAAERAAAAALAKAKRRTEGSMSNSQLARVEADLDDVQEVLNEEDEDREDRKHVSTERADMRRAELGRRAQIESGINSQQSNSRSPQRPATPAERRRSASRERLAARRSASRERPLAQAEPERKVIELSPERKSMPRERAARPAVAAVRKRPLRTHPKLAAKLKGFVSPENEEFVFLTHDRVKRLVKHITKEPARVEPRFTGSINDQMANWVRGVAKHLAFLTTKCKAKTISDEMVKSALMLAASSSVTDPASAKKKILKGLAGSAKSELMPVKTRVRNLLMDSLLDSHRPFTRMSPLAVERLTDALFVRTCQMLTKLSAYLKANLKKKKLMSFGTCAPFVGPMHRAPALDMEAQEQMGEGMFQLNDEEDEGDEGDDDVDENDFDMLEDDMDDMTAYSPDMEAEQEGGWYDEQDGDDDQAFASFMASQPALDADELGAVGSGTDEDEDEDNDEEDVEEEGDEGDDMVAATSMMSAADLSEDTDDVCDSEASTELDMDE